MFRYRPKTIKSKITIIFSLLIAAVALFIYLYFPAKLAQQAVKEISGKAGSIAQLSAYSISPALYFEDKISARDIIEGVKQEKNLSYIIVKDKNQKIFVSHNLKIADRSEYLLTANPVSEDGLVYKIKSPILLNNAKIGEIYIGLSLNEINNTIFKSKLSVAFVSIFILIIGMISVSFLSSFITKELNEIVLAARKITKGDLQVRTEVTSDDEVGQLGDAFNIMVANLEEVYKELEEVNKELEDRVVERTALLQQEIKEHSLTVEKLYKSETKMRSLLNALPDLIFLFSKEGEFLECAFGDSQNLLLPPEQFLGKNIKDVMPFELADKVVKKISDTINSGLQQSLEYELFLNGRMQFFEARFVISWENEILAIIRNITDSKESENKIIESEAKFRALTETMPSAIIIVHGSKFVYVNPGMEVLTGYSQKELLDLDFWEVIHPQFRELVKERGFARQAGKEIPSRYEFKLLTKQDTYRWIDFSARLIDFQGKKVILGTAIDITERKNAEEQLKKLSRAVEQSSVSIVITDCNGNIEYVNPKFSQTTGFELHEVIGNNVGFLQFGIITEEEDSQIWRTIRNGKEWRGELLNKKKTGELYWEITSISSVKNSDGEITHFIAVKEDITEKKLVEEKLIQSERDYRGLFENAHEAFLIFDQSEFIILDANPQACKIFGFQRNELLGRKLNDLIRESPGFNQVLQNLQRGNILKSFETVHYKKNGIKIFLEVNATQVNYHGSKAILAMYRDITERKKFESELLKAKEKAEKSDRLKSEFLAQISHEIRTPINAILSFNSLLKYELEDKVPDDLQQSFRIIDNGGRRLIRTIDLILNMSQIQTGNYELHKGVFDIEKDLLSNIFLEFENLAKAKNLIFELRNAASYTKVNADHYTVTQIFSNLIDNAIKFTRTGFVKIHIYNNGSNSICVDISDSGVGISEEYVPRLFTPFSQEETGYTRSFEGNGLGLALVKKYTELNHAQIKVKSKKGEGSVFTVTFK